MTGAVAEDDGGAPAEREETAPVGHPIVSGAPTDAELAAIIAVIEARIEESEADARQPRPVHRSAWERPILRSTLRPGTGSWRGFAGS